MVNIRVQGGTNAGRRRPLREPAGPWECHCEDRSCFGGEEHYYDGVWGERKVQPGYLVRCPDCGAARDAARLPIEDEPQTAS